MNARYTTPLVILSLEDLLTQIQEIWEVVTLDIGRLLVSLESGSPGLYLIKLFQSFFILVLFPYSDNSQKS